MVGMLLLNDGVTRSRINAGGVPDLGAVTKPQWIALLHASSPCQNSWKINCE